MPDPNTTRAPRTPGGPIGAAVSWAIVLLVALLIGLSQANVSLGDPDAADSPAEIALQQPGEPGITGSEDEPPVQAESSPPPSPTPAAEEDAATAAEPEGPDPDAPDAETESGAMLSVVARSVVGTPKDERRAGMTNIDRVAQTDVDRLRLAILYAYVFDHETARGRLEALEGAELSPGLQRDLATFQRLYTAGEGALSDEEAERMSARHGWFWDLALASMTEPDSEVRARLEEEARTTYYIATGASLSFLLMLVASFGLFITAIVMVATGKIRTRYVPPQPGGSAYIETFAAFLLAFMLLSMATAIALASGSETVQQVAEPAMHILRWGLLGALAWPLLRGSTWRDVRASIGWVTPRGFFREVGCGIVGYFAALPLIALGATITITLTALVDNPMPTHPLPEMLAQAGLAQIILLVVLATLWAPIVEETFFRGALYHHLRGRLHWALAGLVSGLIFAAIHPQGLLAIPALMGIALMLAMLREWRGSLVASMTAHALNNGMITALVLLLMKVQ